MLFAYRKNCKIAPQPRAREMKDPDSSKIARFAYVTDIVHKMLWIIRNAYCEKLIFENFILLQKGGN